MNQNYNLMRLANLYGGMNKRAQNDAPANENGWWAPIWAAVARGELTVPEAIEALKKSPNYSDGTPVLGSQEAADMVLGASGATPPVIEPAVNVVLPGKAPAAPGLFDKSMDWVKANPLLAGAIGAGALGLGGYGAYKALSNDEEEEHKKSASYIDPYTAQVLAHDYITKMARANGIPAVAAGVTGVSNYLNY